MSKQREQTDQEKYLQANRAWNWQWCDEHNRWMTIRPPPMTGAPKTCFTSTGPSKRTLGKRAAKGKRTSPAYL